MHAVEHLPPPVNECSELRCHGGGLGGAVDQRQSQLEPAVDGVDISRACCFAMWAMAAEQAFMAASSARVLLLCHALWLRDGAERRRRGGDDDYETNFYNVVIFGCYETNFPKKLWYN